MLAAVCMGLAAGLNVVPCPAAEAKMDLQTLRAQRREAAQRRRRIIFNNDGDDVIYTKKDPTPAALLALRTAPLVGSQVDSIFYSNSLCFGQSLHRSAVMEPFTCRDYIFKDNALPDYLARGIDPIQVMVDFGHQHGIEVLWDMRVNDTHDAMTGGYGPYLRPKLKLEHPEFLCGTEATPPRHGTWCSVDYTHPEIRDLALRFFEEVCRRFDVDGIELDFFRHPCFFKTVADGGQATEAELEAMTEVVRRTREMTEAVGVARGRPILVAIRVPDSIEYCRGIGLDVERWLAEGLVDLLSGSCYFQLNSWEYLVALGHRHGVPVYPCLSDSRVRGESRFRRSSIKCYRARAMQAWAAGADGIYMFNYFDPRGPVWRELGDPGTLSTLDKLYFVTVVDGSPDTYLSGGRRHRRLPMLVPGVPTAVGEGEGSDVELAVGDDVAQATRDGWLPEVTCHVWASRAWGLGVRLNGSDLGRPVAVEGWLDYPVSVDLLRKGANRFGLTVDPPVVASRAEDAWDVVYEGTVLPVAPWRREGTPERCVVEVRDGALLIADRGTQGGDYAFFRHPAALRPTEPAVIEACLKPVSGWSSILVENGVSGVEVQFFTDRVEARSLGLRYALDAAGTFHTYRIEVQDRDFRVFVDGELRIDGTGRYTQPAWNGRSGIAFGGANSPSLGEALWRSVRLRGSAVAVLDLALSIRYRKP